MNIRVGTIGCTPGWEELLRQEGVPFVDIVPSDLPPGGVSVVVVCRPLTRVETSWLKEHLRAGGGLVGDGRFLNGIATMAESEMRLRFLMPDDHPVARGMSLMDIETMGRLPREANCCRTHENSFAIFAGELLGGVAVVLPFDPGNVMQDFRASERYFYADPERLPSERVSRVAKGEVLHLVHSSLAYVHHMRGIPYARLSPMPAGCKNVFAFRIDSDKGTREEIDALDAIAGEYRMAFSWFLDVKSHEEWLSRFRAMEGQEIGLHCYEHRVYLDALKDGANIRRGIAAMKAAGLVPRSYAAPFGFWSPDLARIVDEWGFDYSSEFSWAYDTFPHFPVMEGVRLKTLQVPIHPVSIGSLRQVGFSTAQMKEYYDGVIEMKIRRGDPLFFFHHPVHRELDVVRSICARAQGDGIRSMTLAGYASWWKRRSSLLPELSVEGGVLTARCGGGEAGSEVAVLITRQAGEEAEVGLGTTALEKVGWRGMETYHPPAEIRRTREFDLRGEIGRQFTRLQRRFM